MGDVLSGEEDGGQGARKGGRRRGREKWANANGVIGRLDHIAEHFENRLDISQWSHSLMIIGLLKQPKPEFNVLEAWRSIVDPDDDRCLEWSREDAAELKSKLEYRRGSPLELAREAFRTAMTMAGGEGDGGGGSDGEGDRMSIVEEALWKEPKGEMG
jgi:hypothetical protein